MTEAAYLTWLRNSKLCNTLSSQTENSVRVAFVGSTINVKQEFA